MLIDGAKDWRELLGQITSDPLIMQRVIRELRVRDITVKRWIKGESGPRSQNLRRLLNALPEYRERLIMLFSEDYEDFPDFSLDESAVEIPSDVYTQIFQMRSMVSRTQCYWSITNAIIGEALNQLDADNLGMAITIVRCMRSSCHEKVYSLRQSIGQGTSPWPGNLERKSMFLGAESLAGFAVSTCRPVDVQDYQADSTALPGHQFELERSAIAYPILYAGRIAGCLMISSIEPGYFLSPTRQGLIGDYADLMSLAFDADDFLEPSQIELRILPLHAEQERYFDNFRKRLTDAKMKLSDKKSHIEAEQYVWEEIENEIFEQEKQKYQQVYEIM
jgi:hypothetical protein